MSTSSEDRLIPRTGRHRRRRTTSAVLSTATLAPAAAGLLITFAPTATAAPIDNSGGGQAGITSPSQAGGGQAGITSTPPSAPAPAPSAPEPQPTESFWVAPPAEYNRGTRAYDPQTGGGVSMTQYNSYSGDGTGNAAPVPSVPVVFGGPTLPIEAPAKKVRFGRVIFDQPNWATDPDAERTNRTTAVAEAMVTDFHKSTGMETEEAEKIASAQVAGVALGAGAGFAAGCLAAGTPTALVTSTVAGIAGAGMGGMVPLPVPGVAPVTTGVAGTALGAAAGFGTGCAVGGGLGAVGGGLAGYAVGTAYGAGEDATPIEVEVPDVESDQIVEQVDASLAQWSEDPVGAAAVEAVQTFATETAPAIDTQVREFVQAQPGGAQLVEQADQALGEFFTDATPGLASRLVSEAVGLGLGADELVADAPVADEPTHEA